jgi:hypothetical protein
VALTLEERKRRARDEGLDGDAASSAESGPSDVMHGAVHDAAGPKAAIIDMFVTGARDAWAAEVKVAAAEAEAARVTAKEEAPPWKKLSRIYPRG